MGLKLPMGNDGWADHASSSLREHQDHPPLDLESVKKGMKTLAAKVNKIYDENMYDINGVAVKLPKQSSTESGGGSSSSRGSNTSKVIKEKVVVGFEEEVNRLIYKLDDGGGCRPLEIISIIGAGGSGKTTLAREVYDHPFTSYTFEIRAWIDVSQDYDTTRRRDLLIRILESITLRNFENSSDDKLGEDILRWLKGKKYLIVMDDIWGIEAWNDIQRSFPKECMGSKVLFTSRLLVQLDRVLNFPSGSCYGEIGTGHLVHLRYLAYSFYGVRALPFPYLLNLETLNLKSPEKVIKLPRDIFKMVKLRHLYTKEGVFNFHLSRGEVGSIGCDRSSKLDNLQTLHQICACEACRSFLIRTPNLRKLGLHGGVIPEDNVLRFPNLECFKCLETLTFTTKLAFDSTVESTLPPGLKLPLTITRITLKNTCLKWEELSLLQTLPSLEVLKLLDYACCGPVWNTSELNGFPELKYLRFYDLDIKKWIADDDKFPKLEVLVLEFCRELEGIPIEFGNLNELREIKLEWCRGSAEESAWKILDEQRHIKLDDDCLNLIAINNWG
ncbi:hypothetical protein Vadar_010201 [Vaccinium darrowii]|uniref:Uncharacterized protein n=1 Tax=Vaccinium darrowii TaxID=229202 RepID=A0ACB7XXZ8_9ERIC|nr:hypothetical protein Vadar_010201 [Vaccinium darrowii]